MKYPHITLAAAALLAAAPVLADDAPVAAAPAEYTFMDSITSGTPMTNFRLRYETVAQDGNGAAPFASSPLKDAQAVTLRSLVGWQTAPFHNFSVGVQFINVAKLDDDFNARAHNLNTVGHEDKAIVADPDYTNINQLYIDWTGIRNTKVRLGRQSVKLDNVRFIGNVEFRQVMQVFDGVSIENKTIPDTELYGAYFSRLKKTNTDLKPDHTGIAHALYRFTPTESLAGYGYFYDQRNTAVASNGSNITYGARLDGVHPINPDFRILYTAEYAKQTDFEDSSNRTAAQGQIDADYYKVGGGAGYGAWWARVDQEFMSSNNGLYAFQTPLGTNHLFQGWVDKFLTTPNAGMRDTFITAGGKFMDVVLETQYHWYKSDRDFTKVTGGLGNNYGTEWNISAAYNYNKNIMGKLEYGTFREGDQYLATASRIRNTDKLWLTAMYTF